MARLNILLTLLSFFLASWAVDVHGTIRPNEVCSEIAQLGRTKIVLDNGVFTGTVTRDGSFVIPDVPSGTYILSVLTHDFGFDNLRIDVVNSNTTPTVRPYTAGTPLDPPSQVLLQFPVVLTPKHKHMYFTPLGSFDLLTMFSNPMMLFLGITACMAIAMPYLLKNMDPELLQEMKERQEKTNGVQRIPPSNTNTSISTTPPKTAEPQKVNAATGKATGGKKSNRRK